MLSLGQCQMAGIWHNSFCICEPTDPFSGSKMQKRKYNSALKCLELGSREELGTEEACRCCWFLTGFTHQQRGQDSNPLNDYLVSFLLHFNLTTVKRLCNRMVVKSSSLGAPLPGLKPQLLCLLVV